MNISDEWVEMQRLAQIGSWYWIIATDQQSFSPQLCTIFGRKSIPIFPEQSGTLYLPEVWRRLQAAVQHTIESAQAFDLDLPALRGDGTGIWIHSRGEAICNALGEVIGVRGTVQDITQRRIAEEKARLHSALLDAVGQAAIATDTQGIINYINRAAEDLYGWPASLAVGRSILEVTVPQLAKDQAAEIMTALSAGRPWAGEFPVQHKDGTVFLAEVHDTPVINADGDWIGVIGISSDIRARKTIEAALELERRNLAAAFENSAVGFVLSDAQGNDISMNDTARRLFGYDAQPLPHPNLHDQIGEWELHDIDGQLIPTNQWPLARAVRGDFVRDFELHCHNLTTGNQWICKLTVGPVRNSEGGVMRIVQTLFDITETKRLEQALRDKNTELKRTTRIAEEASQAKSAFLSRMSHELRSPLHTILGFAQLLDSEQPPPTLAQTASVEQILKAGWYLLELINEILDLAQIESGKLSISSESTSLTEVLRECRAMTVPQGRKRGVTVTFQEPDASFFVSADRTRLKQVLINLLTNAIKYNRPGGSVIVRCSIAPSGSAQSRVRVTIVDTGIGLTEQMLLELFQPFNRLGREHSGEEGTGIGLVMSKRLVELMGGAIGVTSTVGEGSEFWIELNAAANPKPDSSPVPLAPHDSAQLPSNPVRHTLLYVEDDPAAKEWLVLLLSTQRPDIRIFTASDGDEGIRLARRKQPDLILMDINLPGISGIEALKILRKDPFTASIPVVAFSANALPRDIQRGLDAGFFRYLTKPIKANLLLLALEEALEFQRVEVVSN